MREVPRAAAALGAAGLLPFAWGAATILWPALGDWGRDAFGARLTGRPLLAAYGTVILSFMAGAVWGFAARGPDGGRAQAALLGLSVLPALWALGLGWSVAALMLGFVALLPLDRACVARGLAPAWWMRLRLPLTAGVLLGLLPGLP